jgi:hypothetical protein
MILSNQVFLITLTIFIILLVVYIIIDIIRTSDTSSGKLYIQNKNNFNTSSIYNSKLWLTIKLKYPLSIIFPELCIFNTLINKQPNINKVSIAISGGGSRSFVSMIGYFRALNRMGYKNKAQYVSTVSGGSWFYSLYSYCQSNPKYNDDILLGYSCGTEINYLPEPQNISLEQLYNNNKDNKSFFGTIFMFKDLYEYVFNTLLYSNMEISEIWNYSIGKFILEPYGININSPVSASYKHSKDIIKRNPDIEEPLYLLDNMPFWICNTTLFLEDYPHVIVPLTPLYSGLPQILTKNDTVLGGYVVENFAFGNSNILDKNLMLYQNNSCSAQKEVNLQGISKVKTLADMIGTSSTAFASAVYNPKIISKFLESLLPFDSKEFIPKNNIWGKTQIDNRLYSYNSRLGDGVFSDNLGILSLLAREVKHIICFNNCETLISDYDEKCDNTITSLFGIGDEKCISSNLAFNSIKVFDTKEYNNKILPQFKSTLKNGGPTFARSQLNVLPNLINGIKGNYVVDILFILLHPSSIFNNQLSADIKKEITKINITSSARHGEFNNFPNYLTFLQNPHMGAMSLTLPQINILSTYTDWCLNYPELKKHIDEMFSY